MPRPSAIVLTVDVGGIAADAVAVDVLARLQLTARRLGGEIRLRRVSTELQELLTFMGLAGVLRLEAGGQAEEREQRLRAEEEGELDDPVA